MVEPRDIAASSNLQRLPWPANCSWTRQHSGRLDTSCTEHGPAWSQGSEEEFGEIVQYLAKNFPPKAEGSVTTVNVNKASPEELKTTLDIALKDAQAIVAYRQQKGAFKTVEQVEKVPGVDAAKIESKKDRITF